MHQSIYLNRHFADRLSLRELDRLPLKRVEAYYKKYRHLAYKYSNETYPYTTDDLEGNSYFGTDIESQFKGYFVNIAALIETKSKEVNG
ncbi:conserved hypothetical protein [Vibrio chagasii]|nr:conserved hypothetical protein [Vibrio chagasii]